MGQKTGMGEEGVEGEGSLENTFWTVNTEDIKS